MLWTPRRISAPPDFIDGTKGVVLTVFRQPGANIIQTVDRVKAQLPFLEAVLPAGVRLLWMWIEP